MFLGCMQNVFEEGKVETHLKKIMHAEKLTKSPWFIIFGSLAQLIICFYHKYEFNTTGGKITSWVVYHLALSYIFIEFGISVQFS